MTYKYIDEVLVPWAKNRNLHIQMKYKDEDVRSIDKVNPDGKRYQIWIESFDTKDQVEVNVWDYKNKHEAFITSLADLEECLEKAYAFTEP